jgi:transcriptional regulator GlxA family with amidase domain
MKVGFIIYDGMTALDFIGVYDPVTRLNTMGFLPDLHWDVCARSMTVEDGGGLGFLPSKVGESLHAYDMIVVPGGYGARKLIHDSVFMDWLKTAAPCPYKVSVCTGALLLGAAGFLTGKTATTHRTAFNDLKALCASVVDRRIVDEGGIITARGVTSSIDLGLYLCEKLAGNEVQERIRQQMDYEHAATL